MPDSIYDRCIETAYSAKVSVNHAVLEFGGGGYGNNATGRAGVNVHSKDMVSGFQPALLAFCLITGQADIGKLLVPSIRNPFRKSRGAYKAVRTLGLSGTNGHLLASYEVTAASDLGTREAKFVIEGTTAVPAIRSIRPAFETWMPDGPGKIHGHFTMVWQTEDGAFIKGEVDTRYELPNGIELESPIYRRIDFKLDAGSKHLHQDEIIQLFDESTVLPMAA